MCVCVCVRVCVCACVCVCVCVGGGDEEQNGSRIHILLNFRTLVNDRPCELHITKQSILCLCLRDG